MQYQQKIEKLLEKFLKAKCQNQIDVYVKKLLNYLWRLESRELKSTLLSLPLFKEWLKLVVVSWSANKFVPPISITSFVLNLTSILSINQQNFLELNNNDFYIKLINVLSVRQSNVAPSIKLNYIELLTSFISHRGGLELLVVSSFWEDVLKFCSSDNTVIVIEKSVEFLSKFLDKAIDYDENFCNNVVCRIMLPLGGKCLKAIADEASQVFEPTLKLIGRILEDVFTRVLIDNKDFRIAFLFLDHFRLENRISHLMIISQSRNLIAHLLKIMFAMEFLELYLNVLSETVSADFVKSSICRIQKTFLKNLSKGNHYDYMDLCVFGYTYWRLIEAKIPLDNIDVKNRFCFSDQLLCCYLMPSGCLLYRYYVPIGKWEERNLADDYRNSKVHDFYKKVDPNVLRIGYIWRRDLIARSDLMQIATISLKCLKTLKKKISREFALLIFTFFTYSLQDFLYAVREQPEKLEILLPVGYYCQYFELLALLIEEFNITWKDNYEVINVISSCLDFLMFCWPPDEVVQVLKLINVAINKFMSPNMLLLVDLTTDSTLDLLGPLLFAKLVDVFEVRLAALEVIGTIGRLSGEKFPSLQKVLMDSELPTLVVKMSTCDSESFVRATAIKCLQEMIQVEEIWNNALKTEDLPQKMRDVLLNETEGIVRVEAATFMCVAYENQQLPKETLDRVYETMIYSSTTDLHWEVKVRALDFWDKVIKNHLQNQGMIDGSFPNVTFSKEHRKIVTLTDSEIRKRLLKVLSQLSSIGCLGVLMSAIKDDCDMEVSKTAAKISQGLVDLFKKYNVRSDGSTPTSPLPTENGMSTASVSSGVSVDESMDSPATNHHDLNEEIIDQIVNSKDICLLKNVYTPSDYGSVSNYDIQVRRIVTPNEFLQFTQQDLNSIINEKKNWLNGIEDLGSLLDDMLKTYDDDVNNMDCY